MSCQEFTGKTHSRIKIRNYSMTQIIPFNELLEYRTFLFTEGAEACRNEN
jgi:hypothetical protein